MTGTIGMTAMAGNTEETVTRRPFYDRYTTGVYMTGVWHTSRVVRPQALEESLAADLRAARDRGAPLAHRRLSLEVRWGYRYDRYDRYDR